MGNGGEWLDQKRNGSGFYEDFCLVLVEAIKALFSFFKKNIMENYT